MAGTIHFFPLKKNVLSNTKHLHCNCPWLPCKISIAILENYPGNMRLCKLEKNVAEY